MGLKRKIYQIWYFLASLDDEYVIDTQLLISVILLLALGCIMVYSAAIVEHNSTAVIHYHFIHHILAILLGTILGVIVFSIPTYYFKLVIKLVVPLCIVSLILVLIPHIGEQINGAKRWIGVLGFGYEPSEITKLFVIIYTAFLLGSTNDITWKNKSVILVLLMLLIVNMLLLLQPDLGTAVLLTFVVMIMLHLWGIEWYFTVIGVFLIFVAVVIATLISPYRLHRVTSFLRPWHDYFGAGYQLSHSLLAISHGGWFGVGLGVSVEKFYYLPEPYTDFILSIIGEELGAISIVVTLILYCIIFYRGMYHIGRANSLIKGRSFQTFLAQGISLWIFLQALINFGVILGLLPTKGITLPFVSYGGSSMMTSIIAISILLKIDYEYKTIRQKR